jgi:hypothetical protein
MRDKIINWLAMIVLKAWYYITMLLWKISGGKNED